MSTTPNPVSQSPAPSPTPSSAPANSDISAELSAEMDAVMSKAMVSEGGPGSGATQPKPAAAGGKPAGIRGPRVVQAGREHRTGTVVSVGPTDIFVEFGPKELGIVTRIQFKEEELPVVGSQLAVVVDKYEAAESLFVCSRPGAVHKADWELLEVGQTVEAKVTGVTKGGLELMVANHRAFMPASQVSVDRIPDLTVMVGEKVKAQITRIERMGSGNIVLSRRSVMESERAEMAEKLKTTLHEGDTVEGTVRKIMEFGAFIDLGGIDGLVHISDLTYDRTGYGAKAVEKHLKEGQRVSCKIIKLDWEGGRISLGMKQLMGDPFQSAAAITEGAELTGRVTKIAEFGAFVEIAPGVEGLVHISELDHKRINKVEDAVKPDQIITVKVLKVDQANRRVSLSMKAMKPLPAVEIGAGGGGGGMGGGGGGGGAFGGGGKPGGGGKSGAKDKPGRTAEEILKETPALRRMRAKGQTMQFKGGLS